MMRRVVVCAGATCRHAESCAAPARPRSAARSWDADLQRAQLHYTIVSYSIPPTRGSRDEEMVAGRGWCGPARAGTLEQDDYSAGNCPQLHSQREAAAGEQSRAGGGQPGSTATATTTPCPAPHPHWTQCQDYAPITTPIHIK